MEHVNDWCLVIFIRVVYGTMIYMSCPKESIVSFCVSLMKTPMEHYLNDLFPVLHFTGTIFRNQVVM